MKRIRRMAKALVLAEALALLVAGPLCGIVWWVDGPRALSAFILGVAVLAGAGPIACEFTYPALQAADKKRRKAERKLLAQADKLLEAP